jgi:hypothetical protein
MSSLIFVDVEAGFDSPCPGVGETGMTEFGAVEFQTRQTFHGLPGEPNLNVCPPVSKWHLTMQNFADWLKQFPGHPVFVSDNPAYDWQWINYWFWKELGSNPMGFSARRIGDFYAGLRNDFYQSNNWKRLRITNHDHNPVHDAQGNAEAFNRLLHGER